jgi:hypothetical protein
MSTPSPTPFSEPSCGPGGQRKHIYFEPDVLEAILVDADTNRRSVSGTVNYHLRRALGMAA